MRTFCRRRVQATERHPRFALDHDTQLVHSSPANVSNDRLPNGRGDSDRCDLRHLLSDSGCIGCRVEANERSAFGRDHLCELRVYRPRHPNGGAVTGLRQPFFARLWRTPK
jgi:hypothetical protein